MFLAANYVLYGNRMSAYHVEWQPVFSHTYRSGHRWGLTANPERHKVWCFGYQWGNEPLHCYPKWIPECTIENDVFRSVTWVVTIQARRIRGSLPPMQIVPEAPISCKSLRCMKRKVFRTSSRPAISSSLPGSHASNPHCCYNSTFRTKQPAGCHAPLFGSLSSSQFYLGHQVCFEHFSIPKSGDPFEEFLLEIRRSSRDGAVRPNHCKSHNPLGLSHGIPTLLLFLSMLKSVRQPAVLYGYYQSSLGLRGPSKFRHKPCDSTTFLWRLTRDYTKMSTEN